LVAISPKCDAAIGNMAAATSDRAMDFISIRQIANFMSAEARQQTVAAILIAALRLASRTVCSGQTNASSQAACTGSETSEPVRSPDFAGRRSRGLLE